MQERIVVWMFVVLLIISSIIDIFLGLAKSKRTVALKPNFDNWDVVRGIIWLVIGVILIFV